MSQTKEGLENARKTLYARYGGEEGYKEHMREIAALGGKAQVPKGFAKFSKEKLVEASAKGGRAARGVEQK